MRTSIETERLFLRELLPTDEEGMFELDSNPKVHIYLGNNPVKSIEESREMIANIRQQYLENGIGRWAVILKETGEFIGWSGLKLEKNVNGKEAFYDLGYRFMQKHWGKGYAFETAKAFIDFGFSDLKLPEINAYADFDNLNSRKVLEKVGMKYINSFELDGIEEVWYELKNPNK
jgi:ribosomal-protein-alanine N-acetyltransferase